MGQDTRRPGVSPGTMQAILRETDPHTTAASLVVQGIPEIQGIQRVLGSDLHGHEEKFGFKGSKSVTTMDEQSNGLNH